MKKSQSSVGSVQLKKRKGPSGMHKSLEQVHIEATLAIADALNEKDRNQRMLMGGLFHTVLVSNSLSFLGSWLKLGKTRSTLRTKVSVLGLPCLRPFPTLSPLQALQNSLRLYWSSAVHPIGPSVFCSAKSRSPTNRIGTESSGGLNHDLSTQRWPSVAFSLRLIAMHRCCEVHLPNHF